MIDRLYSNPRYVVLLVAIIAISGLAGYVTRPKLEDPKSKVRRGQITTFLSGASPAEVESQVTEPIERVLREAKGIRTIESSSQRGVSIVFVRLTDEIENVENSWSKIQDKLSVVAGQLPPRASKPELVDERRWDSYTTAVALICKREATNSAVLARWGKELENHLRFVEGTRFTEPFGMPREETLVELDEQAIASIGLTPSMVAEKLKSRDSLSPEATSYTDATSTPIEMDGDVNTIDQIRNTVVRDDENAVLRLRDIASVRRGEKQPRQNFAMVDGRRAVVIGTRMDSDYVIDAWTQRHLAAVNSFEELLPEDLELRVLFSQNRYTAQRSRILFESLGTGMVLVISLVWFIMGWRAALPICSALPLTLLVVLFLMIPFGVSLHQTSIAGLILAIGMLIDNPIIVVDHMRRLRADGHSAIDAVKGSLKHLYAPLIGSNLTTMLAFTPLLLIPGTTGEYLGQLGWTVIACLAASLALSFSIVPVLAAWTLPTRRKRPSKPGRYAAILAWLMNHRLLAVSLAAAVPLLGFGFGGELEEQFFPQAERDHFHFSVRLPTQATLQDTERVARKACEILKEHPQVEDIALFVGTNAPMVHYSMVASNENRPEFSQGIVTTKNQVRPSVIRELQDELDSRIPEAACTVTLIEQGPPTVAPIEFRIYGPSLQELHRLGEEARAIMMKVPEVIQTQATLDRGGPSLSVAVRQHDAASANIADELLATQLYGQLNGVPAVHLMEESEMVPVRVSLCSSHTGGPERVFSLPFVTPDQEVVSIESVADWSLARQTYSITRRNMTRCNTVQGVVAAGALPIELEHRFQEALRTEGWRLPTSYHTDFGGVSQERNSAVGNLLAYSAIIAVLIVSVLVFTLRSFRQAAIIGVVAILSLGAGLLSLWSFNFPMGLMAIIGLLGMMGLAINDSIAVLSDLKAGRTQGLLLYESIGKSTKHVLTTSLTTAAGVTPLVIAGGEFWPPMMIVIGGGVFGATLLALVFTPAMYSLICKGGNMNFAQWKRKANVQSNEWIVITGSTSGIGHGFLQRVCDAGCNVIAVSNEAEKLEEDRELMNSRFGVRVENRCVDLSSFEAVRQLGEELASYKIAGLINNAGFGMKGDFLSHSVERYRDIVAVNSTAPMILEHAVLPMLRERNEGLMLNVASINAYVPIPNNQVYTATKSFLMSLALAVEAENADTEITFQLLLPGTTRTPFHDKQGVEPPKKSTMTVDQVVDYSLFHLDQSICIPNSRDRLLSRIIGGPIPKKTLISWVKREAEKRLGMVASS